MSEGQQLPEAMDVKLVSSSTSSTTTAKSSRGLCAAAIFVSFISLAVVAFVVLLFREEAMAHARVEHSIQTPPLANSTELTLVAHGSCSDQFKAQRFWRVVLAAAPQLWVYNGDIVYGDCRSAACHELRDAWSDLLADADFRTAAARLPMEGILDDHDYGLNDCTASNPYKGFAKNLFLSHFRVPSTDPRWNRPGLYTARTFGVAPRRVQARSALTGSYLCLSAPHRTLASLATLPPRITPLLPFACSSSRSTRAGSAPPSNRPTATAT